MTETKCSSTTQIVSETGQCVDCPKGSKPDVTGRICVVPIDPLTYCESFKQKTIDINSEIEKHNQMIAKLKKELEEVQAKQKDQECIPAADLQKSAVFCESGSRLTQENTCEPCSMQQTQDPTDTTKCIDICPDYSRWNKERKCEPTICPI